MNFYVKIKLNQDHTAPKPLIELILCGPLSFIAYLKKIINICGAQTFWVKLTIIMTGVFLI